MKTSPKKTIAVFSGNRAEYGLLYPLLKAFHHHEGITLHLYAGGDHSRLGTLSEIEADGLPIFKTLRYDKLLPNGSPSALMCQASADIMPKMQALLSENRPDCFFVLGDRYESFAATLAAFYEKIPIAHLGGGDVTEGGCVDDALRFMISDLAHLHFTISKESAERLLQRGEEPWRVHVSGSPVIDNIADTPLLNRQALCQQYGINAEKPIVLFTQHPIPAEGEATVHHFAQSLEALAGLGQAIQVIATHPNQDGFGQAFKNLITHSKSNQPNIHWQESLGRVQYLSWLASCDVVLGNSSSGLIETPFFGKPSITVGPRQAGRLRADNVVACDYGVTPVREAVLSALNDAAFITRAKKCYNPFGDKPSAPLVLDVLTHLPQAGILLKKKLFSTSSLVANNTVANNT
ncbi:MAG: UDP-N-acetylglucosamine 2-epimerase [Vampirovibrionales bacterium]|nr:UDP-N-acetylglucosamine 2-epimerase [Vampirovibrionales bacterium]